MHDGVADKGAAATNQAAPAHERHGCCCSHHALFASSSATSAIQMTFRIGCWSLTPQGKRQNSKPKVTTNYFKTN